MSNQDKAIEVMARAMTPALCGSQEDEWGGDLPDKQFDDLPPDWKVAYLRYAQTALAAYHAHLASTGFAIVPVDALKFVCGEGPLDGVWFGEPHPTHKGKYWWRSVIRAMIAAYTEEVK